MATAEQLSKLHAPTGTTFRARAGAKELLASVHDRDMETISPLEPRARRARRDGAPDLEVERELRTLLSRRAPFTMLTRSLVDPSLADLFD